MIEVGNRIGSGLERAKRWKFEPIVRVEKFYRPSSFSKGLLFKEQGMKIRLFQGIRRIATLPCEAYFRIGVVEECLISEGFVIAYTERALNRAEWVMRENDQLLEQFYENFFSSDLVFTVFQTVRIIPRYVIYPLLDAQTKRCAGYLIYDTRKNVYRDSGGDESRFSQDLLHPFFKKGLLEKHLKILNRRSVIIP